jgi:LuxR family maltose regulon positive regulatory protein
MLLTSKNTPPSLPQEYLYREHLHATFFPHQHTRLCLVTSVAGSGKSCAVAEFCERQKNSAWLSIDEEDNEPSRLALYLAVAFDALNALDDSDCRAAAFAGKSLSDSSQLLSMLLQRMEQVKSPGIVVIDDWHLLSNLSALRLMEQVIKLAPSPLRFIVISRKAPDWPYLPSWRLQGAAVELNYDALAFDDREVQRLLLSKGHHAIDNRILHSLNQRLEGWALGWQFIALHSDIAQLLPAINGSHRPLHDYLSEEVLNQQTPLLREFLLTSSCLDRFSHRLLCLLYKPPEAATLLSAVQRAQLFIIGLDRTGQWFRYHHLFQDYLRQMLEKEAPERLRHVCAQAADFWLDEGNPVEAIQYLIRAKDKKRLLEGMKEYSGKLSAEGFHWVLGKAWRELSLHDIIQHGQTAVSYGWYLFLVSRERDKALDVLEKGEYVHYQQNGYPYIPYFDKLRCFIAFDRADYSEVSRLFSEKLIPYYRERPEYEANAAGLYALYGELAFSQGELDRSYEYYQKELKLIDRLLVDAPVWAMHQLAVIDFLRGNAEASMNWLVRADEKAQELALSLSFGYWCSTLARSELAYARHWLDDAETFANVALEKSEYHDSDFWRMPSAAMQIRVALQRQQLPASQDVFRLGEHLRQHDYHPFTIAQANQARLYYWRISDDTLAAQVWLSECAEPLLVSLTEPTRHAQLNARNLALAYLLVGNNAQAKNCLVSARAVAEQKGYLSELLQFDLLMMYQAGLENDEQAAVFHLTQALNLVCDLDYIGYVMEYRQCISTYLQKCQFDSDNTDMQRLVERIDGLCRQRVVLTRALDSMPAAVKAIPLTTKEWQILQRIVQGQSNEEIADTTFVALGTVKSHISRMYRKMKVKNRKEAIAKGMQWLP